MEGDEPDEQLLLTLRDLKLPFPLKSPHSDSLSMLRNLMEENKVERELNDTYLLRFLAARDFNPELSFDFLRQHLLWIDQFSPHPSELGKPHIHPNLLASDMFCLMGNTKSGHPILQFKLKNLDPEMHSLEDFEKYVVFVLEHGVIRNPSAVSGKCVWIFDLEGWSVYTHGSTKGREFTKQILLLAQNHYPERLHQALLIQSPWGFSTAWSFISMFLDKKTQDKVKFLNSRKELHEIIDISVLPKSYYGTHEEYTNTF